MEKTETTEMDKDKEKGKRTKKMGSGKEGQRGTQERRYEGEGTSNRGNEDGKSEGIILERSSGFKKKKRRRFLGLRETI
jgi:hypothetical protein